MTAPKYLSPVVVLALLALGTLLSQGCESRRPPPDDSWFGELATGHFLTQGRWVDLRARFLESDGEKEDRSWLLEIGDGQGGLEPWGIWGLGKRTLFDLFVTFPGRYDFVIVCRAPRHPDGLQQRVEVRINDRSLGSFAAATTWETHRLEVSPAMVLPGSNHLELRYAHHLDGIPGRDERPLALAIERVGLLRPGETAELDTSESIDLDGARETLWFRSSGTLLVPIEEAAGASTLELELVRPLGSALGRDQPKVAAGLLGLEEASGVRGLPVPGLWQRSSRHRIELGPGAAAPFVSLSVELPPGQALGIRSPRLMTSAAPPAREAETPGASSLAKLPDVVLVVLDAARPDHFSTYGYPRQTTPNIDRLAARSLVFRDAVAECPYTLCSMPNLLTGLSFVRHGVVEKGHTLDPQVVTLAEALSDLGYFSIGVTGNPNSGRSRGAAQGFDEFYETWQLARGRNRWHPHYLTRHVSERLEQGLPEQPLFLFLHYVPPHSPYSPDPRFDLFGDPDYDGPVSARFEFMEKVFRQRLTFENEDLAEIIALYDGNLRMADDALGELFTALDAAGRWRDALVVLTSDHGEAFQEHGVLGHNTTLYEEMLRVPLIVRLPQGQSRADADLESPASLGDVMPTILAALGQDPPASADGIDLLSVTDRSRRALLARTASQHAVRTARLKAIFRDSGKRELYDLREDAGEHQDLAGRERLLTIALASLLERKLAAASPATSFDDAEGLSEADREMLRSLGYL